MRNEWICHSISIMSFVLRGVNYLLDQYIRSIDVFETIDHTLHIKDIFSQIASHISDLNTFAKLFMLNKITYAFRNEIAFTHPVNARDLHDNILCIDVIFLTWREYIHYDKITKCGLHSFVAYDHALPLNLKSLTVMLHIDSIQLQHHVENHLNLEKLRLYVCSCQNIIHIPIHVKSLKLTGHGGLIVLNQYLERLTLFEYDISQIDFSLCVNLQHLFLTKNEFHRIPFEIFKSLKSLHILSLECFLKYNDIPCTIDTLMVNIYDIPLIMPSHIKTLIISVLRTSFDQSQSELKHVQIKQILLSNNKKLNMHLPSTIEHFEGSAFSD